MSAALKYGLIAGASLCGWILVGHSLDIQTTRHDLGAYGAAVASVIPLSALFLLLKNRRAASDGGLSLGWGVGAGLHASFVAALTVYGFLLLYNQFINPGWMDAALEWKVVQFRAQGMTEPAIRAEILSFRWMNSPRGLFLPTLAGMTVLGGLCSLVLTLLLRRVPRDRIPGSD